MPSFQPSPVVSDSFTEAWSSEVYEYAGVQESRRSARLIYLGRVLRKFFFGRSSTGLNLTLDSSFSATSIHAIDLPHKNTTGQLSIFSVFLRKGAPKVYV